MAVFEGSSAREEIDNKRVAAQGKEVARTEAAELDHLKRELSQKTPSSPKSSHREV